MRAMLCEQYGPPEGLRLREVADPTPGHGEVLVRTVAAGVNFPDALIIRNLYQFKPALPFAPGSEASGIVAAVGEGVTGFAIGERVAALIGHGAFADLFVAPAARLMRVPDDVDLETAAGLLMTYGTSHHALKQRARLQPGETLLVLGASGGVGLAAVDLGKRMGARVIAAASSPEKLAICRAQGADETIDYSTEDLREGIRRIVGARGVDVVYDPVGDRFAEPAFRSLAWNGRHLVIGFAGGAIPKLPLNLALIKGASLVGVFWGAFVDHEPDVHRANVEELLQWLRAGEIRPHISARYPLDRAGDAIRALMDRRASGKVLVTMAS